MMKRILFGITLLALLLCACGENVSIEPQEGRIIAGQDVRVEEITFRSGKFKVVGDLLMPAEGDRLPAVILVHGDGPATRRTGSSIGHTTRIFLQNGYAVFSWDKPGSGESTGQINNALTQRAEILADGIAVLAEYPNIDPGRIGLWGISQAGWVMPLALDLRDDVAFMIVVSGGAEDSIEQAAYIVSQEVLSDGGTEEEAALVERYWSQQNKATEYDEYHEAMEVLMGIPQVQSRYDMVITEENRWKPVSRDFDLFIDPMGIIEHTTIPVLAIFGEWDKIVDPVQGAEAYEAALHAAGNQDYQIEVLPRAPHNLENMPEYRKLLEGWLQHLSK
ncbi:MAG: alpha/beta hydrolase [Chloroflexota bacterium]|nr:MAG: alpha/beta hydrolase [Chloroflexota bacterium]